MFLPFKIVYKLHFEVWMFVQLLYISSMTPKMVYFGQIDQSLAYDDALKRLNLFIIPLMI
jgi:hypothetical protein